MQNLFLQILYLCVLVLCNLPGDGLKKLESLNQRVRGLDALASVLGRRVLAAIPYIPTQAELSRRRKWLKILVVSGVLMITTLLVLVHLLYMPLDLLIFKALARFE